MASGEERRCDDCGELLDREPNTLIELASKTAHCKACRTVRLKALNIRRAPCVGCGYPTNPPPRVGPAHADYCPLIN